MKKTLAFFIITLALTGACLAQGATGNATPNVGAGAPGGEERVYAALKNIYLIGLGLVGVSALFVIVWGGLEYMTAGESSQRVEKGKKRIWNGVYGIILAATSYAILYTINPDLISLHIGTPSTQQFSPGGGSFRGGKGASESF